MKEIVTKKHANTLIAVHKRISADVQLLYAMQREITHRSGSPEADQCSVQEHNLAEHVADELENVIESAEEASDLLSEMLASHL